MLKIDYPTGYGPENNLPLDVSNSFMVDIPAGYQGTFVNRISGDWEQAICGYSTFSGAKVFQVIGRSEGGTIPSIHNHSQMMYSYLFTGWYKDPAVEQWKQTESLHVDFKGFTGDDNYEFFVRFSGITSGTNPIRTDLSISLNHYKF